MGSKRGNPNMIKGAPSVNPDGRAVTKAKAPSGVTGVSAYGGYISHGEANADLTGGKRWVTYTNAMLIPVVALGVRYFTGLLAGTKWHAEPNERGGKDAERGALICTEGLLEAPLRTPWSRIVPKAAMCRYLGFSLHATAMRRRPDGMIVYSAIEHRPQHTIEKWIRANEHSPFESVIQRSKESGQEIPISLDECFYCVDDTLTDSPEGVGLLRHIVELVRRLGHYELLEGVAYEQDLGGTPFGGAPLSETARKAKGDAAQVKAAVDEAMRAFNDLLNNRNKNPTKPQYHVYDSEPYRDTDGKLTTIPKWKLDIIKGETANLPSIHTVIGRIQLEIARVLGVEFALVGGGDAKGSYGMHEDKTSMFATILQTTLDELGWFATQQLARRLVARNGLDPDTCTPKLIAEPISTEAVLTATQALAQLNMAGLAPNDPAKNVIRSRMHLPPEPERDLSLLLPRAPEPPPPPKETENEEIETEDPDKDAKETEVSETEEDGDE